MSLAEELKTQILTDPYFLELFQKAELAAAKRFIQQQTDTLTQQEYSDLMRYSDILSHSFDAEARNKAYKIIALLADEPTSMQNAKFVAFAEAILSKLGNFPALKYLSECQGRVNELILPIEREIEVDIKRERQKTYDNKFTLTDSQYQIRHELEQHDFFSFSGPTSLGKSFIIKDYIHTLVDSPEMKGNCIVVLVPTRALIGQITKELQEEIIDKTINVSGYPTNSKYVQQKYNRTIYVFTPERLLSYVSNQTSRVAYLFVDEAQKLTSIKDSRSSLYYHAIYETIRKFATKLVFASPNIPNPDVFLSIFEKDQKGTLSIKEQTVSQNRFFIDLVAKEAYYYSDIDNTSRISIEMSQLPPTSTQLIQFLGDGFNNLVYCNGTDETVRRARDFANALNKITHSKKLDELITFIRDFVHEDYYLLECLEKGVAFHHGRMPQQVRKKIEEFFMDKSTPLKYMFCTSTLLEGINLPAKNIFVVNDHHGSNKFKKIDFENLIGRAGRLTKEFSGNVVCVRDSSQRWTDSSSLLERGSIDYIDSFLTNHTKAKKKEFANIAKALSGKPMAMGLSNDERQNYSHYASIMLLHHLENEGSALKVGFLEKNSEAIEILQEAKRNNNIPTDILRVSSTINPKYQNLALSYIANIGETAALPPINKNTDFFLILDRIYDLYDWGQEETGGRNPLIPKALVKSGHGKMPLYYWAMLMKHWINGEPLSLLIRYSIGYYKNRGEIWFHEEGRLIREDFTANKKQINIVIEQIMADIENGLRFKIEKYLLNYYLLCKFQLGEKYAGQNWAEQVEYGTSNRLSIELQNVGFSRSTATYILFTYRDLLTFDEHMSLININEKELLESITSENEHYQEIISLLG